LPAIVKTDVLCMKVFVRGFLIRNACAKETIMCYQNLICRILLTLFLLMWGVDIEAQFVPDEWSIPTNGNSYITKMNLAEDMSDYHDPAKPLVFVGRAGIILKNDTLSVASTYIYITKPSDPMLLLNVVGSARLKVTCGNQHFTVNVNNQKSALIEVGTLHINSPQYICLEFKLENMGQPSYVVINKLVLSGMSAKPFFINNNFDTDYGLRGPSVHLVYDMGESEEAEWTYNEVTVPVGGDVVGSYYCAQGFDCGYFGIQYNGINDKRVIFSVWNAMDSDNPGAVLPEYRVTVADKGNDVEINDFGNEGSGKQSILKYDWHPGKTYKFLVHAVHPDTSSTDYTAYFFVPEENHWVKMATMHRPHTKILLTGTYSFLENFIPHQGYLMRKAYYGNLWFKDKASVDWHFVRNALFTNDETGRRGIRVDYEGGVEGSRFYLKMGGYFGDGSKLNRQLKLSQTPTGENDKVSKDFIAWLEKEIETLKK